MALNRIVGALPGVSYLSNLFFSSAYTDKPKEDEFFPEYKITDSAINLPPAEGALLLSLQQKATLIKKHATHLHESYLELTQIYSSEKLFCEIYSRLSKVENLKKYAKEWNKFNFPNVLLDATSKAYCSLITDAKAIIEYASYDQLPEIKKIQSAKMDLETVFLAAAWNFHAHCNFYYKQAANKTFIVEILLAVCRIFQKYAEFKFNPAKEEFEFNVKPILANDSIAHYLEDIILSLNQVKDFLIVRPAHSQKVKLHLDAALNCIQDGFNLLPAINQSFIFVKNNFSSTLVLIDDNDIERDNLFIKKRDKHNAVLQNMQYKTFESLDRLAKEAESVLDMFRDLKDKYQQARQKIITCVEAYCTEAQLKAREIANDLASTKSKLNSELSIWRRSPNRYAAYLDFKKSQAQAKNFISQIYEQKKFFHNQFESLKSEFCGGAIEDERQAMIAKVLALAEPCFPPLNATNSWEGVNNIAGSKLAALANEKNLKDILKILKNETLSDHYLKTKWAAQVQTILGRGGIATNVRDNGKESTVRVPHAAAAIRKLLYLYTDEHIDKLNLEEVKKLFADFRKIILDRQAKRSRVIVWCSCFGLQSAVRTDSTFNFYFKLAHVDLDKVQEADVDQFRYENAIVRTSESLFLLRKSSRRA